MNAASTKVLIRCDGAPEIGFGHVVRCLALADELRDSHGCQVGFAMLQGPQGFEQILAQGYQVHLPQDNVTNLDEGEWLQLVVSDTKTRALVLDVRTDLAMCAVRTIRESGVLIVTIDDLSERRLLADLAFYPPVPQVKCLDWTGFTGQCFVGWEWVLLRPQFAEAALQVQVRETGPNSSFASAVQQLTLLVTMGGSDPAGLTLMALDAIEQLDFDFRVLLIIGGGFVHEAALADRLARAKLAYEIRRDVTDMSSIMVEADLAITSFGVTAYELAATRVPSIYLCLTEDHAKSATAFEDVGFGINLGIYSKISSSTLANNILELMQNATRRDPMKLTDCRVDGLGVRRIGDFIGRSLIFNSNQHGT